MEERDRLLAAIVADPDAVENWVVYADWLAERDDPRGELINLELAIEAGAADKEVVMRHRELQRDEDALLSSRLLERAHHFDLEWWRGFIRSAAAFGAEDDPPVSEDLAALYADPHACMLRQLTLPAALHHTCATLACPAVRRLVLKDCRVAELALAHGFPLLAELVVASLHSPLESVAHPELTSYDGPASGLRRHDVPRLRSLSISGSVIALFEPRGILSRPPPSLTQLSVGAVTADEITALRTSPVVAQLRVLAFRELDVEQVDELARDPAAFRHLELDIFGITETSAQRDELVARVSALSPNAQIRIEAMNYVPDDDLRELPRIEAAVGERMRDAVARFTRQMRGGTSEDV